MTNKELVLSEDYFNVFIENHLKIYPKDRLNVPEKIDPLKAMRLFQFSEKLKQDVLNDENLESYNKLLTDLHITKNEILQIN